MRLIDKIALNSLIKTVLNFILSILTILVPQSSKDNKKHKILPWRNRND
jgi:hypothetical protein